MSLMKPTSPYEQGYNDAYEMKAANWARPIGQNSDNGKLAYGEGYKQGVSAMAWEKAGKGPEKGLIACAYIATMVRINAVAGIGA